MWPEQLEGDGSTEVFLGQWCPLPCSPHIHLEQVWFPFASELCQAFTAILNRDQLSTLLHF